MDCWHNTNRRGQTDDCVHPNTNLLYVGVVYYTGALIVPQLTVIVTGMSAELT